VMWCADNFSVILHHPLPRIISVLRN